MKLHEVAVRDDQLKAIFLRAIDQAIEKYPEAFEGNEKAALAALSKLHTYATKIDIAAALQGAGVGEEGTSTAREIAQFLITTSHRLDK